MLRIRDVYSGSRIRIMPSRNPDPGSKIFLVLRIRDVYSGSRIRIMPSRNLDPGSKRSQIRIRNENSLFSFWRKRSPKAVLRIRIRRNRRMFFGLPDLDRLSEVRIRIILLSKNSKKNLDSYCFESSLWLFICKKWRTANVPLKRSKQKT